MRLSTSRIVSCASSERRRDGAESKVKNRRHGDEQARPSLLKLKQPFLPDATLEGILEGMM